jgi:hypothetical protein
MKKNTRDEERNLSTEFDYSQRKISPWICSDANACGMSVTIRDPNLFLEAEASTKEI